MATKADWLDRLDNVFDYQALAQLFSDLAAQAEAGREDPGLASKIDDCIRRIEEERASDQRELDGIRERYETFQQANRGFVGWVKRHVPFTETRRQDLEHRSELADQQAEVLADNLVIARAQMLKERFLAPADRRLGRRPLEWQRELQPFETVTHLASLAPSLRALAAETERSRGFLDLVKKEIDAFASAAFAAKEDRARRDADLTAARSELADLLAEAEQKEKLKLGGLTRLGRFVAEELTATSAAFREDARQLAELESSAARLGAAHEALDQLKTSAERVGAQTKELQGIPEQLQSLRVERQQAERRQTDAAMAEARKAAVAEERRIHHDEARRRFEQAQQALASVQQADAAWRAQHTPDKTMAQMVEAGPDNSPHAAHLREAQAAVSAEQAAYQHVLQSFEMAKQDAAQSLAAIEAGRGQVAAIDGRMAALEQRRAQLQRELPQSAMSGQAAFARAAAALATYLNNEPAGRTTTLAPPYGCVSGNQLNASWGDALLHADRDFARHLQAVALLEQLSQWQRERQQELDRDRASIRQRRTAAWKQRCRDLVGDALADGMTEPQT
ncbi:MAG TPA: hypothetical protein VG826_16665 [Pirellulales bacterium]|nr:hypothetical protein [Pirellulales bacterium]